jgi:protein-tyrosine-phosphatase
VTGAKITMVCTGNAARSVMAALLLRDRLGPEPAIEVASAGTLVLPDQPMSVRTRHALQRHGLADPHHRSRQIDSADVATSDLLLIMEPSHLHWMRRRLPTALPLATSLRRAVRDLPAVEGSTLADRVAALGLGDHDFEPWEEVIDPGAGEQDVFDSCIDELAELIDALTPTLRELHP